MRILIIIKYRHSNITHKTIVSDRYLDAGHIIKSQQTECRSDIGQLMNDSVHKHTPSQPIETEK